MIDPTTLALFLQALQGNKNVGSTLGNLDNPMLLFLANQYLPPSGGMVGGGELSSRYAGDPKYPGVNEILNTINSGADEFEVGTTAKALIAKGNIDGFASAEFEKLADELYKESRGEGSSSSSKDYWSKLNQSGFARPIDIYNEQTVPLPSNAAETLLPIALKSQEAISKLPKIQGKAKAADFDENMSAYQFLANTAEGRALAKSEGIDLSSADPGSGTVYSWRGTKRPDWSKASVRFNPLSLLNAVGTEGFRTAEKLWDSATGGADYSRPKRSVLDPRNLSDAVYGQLFKRGKKDEKNNLDLNPNVANAMKKSVAKSRDLNRQRRRAELDVEMLDKEANAYRKGVLDVVAEQGRTPLDDQLAGVMRLLAQNR
jgi:hypothetical protein